MLARWKECLVGLALIGGLTLTLPAQSTQEGLIDLQLAVVDYSVLIKAHPQHEKLKQLDDQVRLLEEERAMVESQARQKLMQQGQDEMGEAIQQARAKLEAEKAAVEAELSSISSSLSRRMAGEMEALQGQYENQIKDAVEGLVPKQADTTAPEPLAQSGDQQVQDFMENLGLIRERNLAARRLELEKRLGSELEAEKARLDGEVAAFEDELSGQYQSEKLNLQLTVQNAADEAEREQAEARLQEISAEIADKKLARRKEVDQKFSAFRTEKTEAMQQELVTYQKELDAEVASKVGSKRAELVASGKLPPQAAPKPQGPPPEIQAEIAKVESSLRAELESKKAELRQRMQAETAVAEERLKKKQAEVEEQLRKTEAEIRERINEQLENLDDELKDELDEKTARLEELNKQRETLYEQMKSELNEKVAGVAEKKEVPMVIGSFVVNRNCEDLTDRAMVAVKQMENL